MVFVMELDKPQGFKISTYIVSLLKRENSLLKAFIIPCALYLFFPFSDCIFLDFVLSEGLHEVHWSMVEAMQSNHAHRTDRNTLLIVD